MKHKKLFAVTLIVIMLLLVTGSAYVFAKGQSEDDGKSFTFSINNEIASMLPYKVRNPNDTVIVSLMYETLLRFDANGNPQPYLASSITEDLESLTYTIQLKEGIRFSDGSEFNADVCKWNLDMYKELGVLSSSFLTSLASVEVTGDYEVVLHMSEWDSLLPFALARQCGYMVSEAAYESMGEAKFTERPVGTGPYKLVDWEHDVGMTFEKNEDYWQGVPEIDTIHSAIYSTELVARAALESDAIQAMFTDDFETAEYLDGKGFNVIKTNVPRYAYSLCYNCTEPEDPFSNALVRKAASYAINSQAVIDSLCKDYGVTSSQWGVPESAFYNDDISGFSYDVDKAKELLAEAGYPDGFATTLTAVNWPFIANISQILASQLTEAGIYVTLNLVETANYVNYIGGWSPGMLLHPMGMENGAASQLAATFVKDLKFALGLVSFYHTDELDALINEAKTSESSVAIELFKQVQKEVFEDTAMMKTIMIVPTMVVTSPKLHDTGFCENTIYASSLWKASIDQ